MSRRIYHRLSALLLAVWMLLSLALPAAGAVQTDTATITIASETDFLAFASNCTLDAWSQGKTFVLTANLDLSAAEFTPIPTFGGTFLGQGHTISGLTITAAGSTQGLFRYIQPSGVVQDLIVRGTVTPRGTRSTVGGIAGDNAGTLQNCEFHGTVQGEYMVGGIAGRNDSNGQIISCSTSGTVSGENATGGIAGRNLGLLLSCKNNAGVNLTQTESEVDLLDADAGAVLEELATADNETYRFFPSSSDTGGIVGWSGGVVQSCVNYGAVGYPHVGYNIGGIAGRQSGYLAGCVNHGVINGRKDVGGIVGQSEPFLLIDPREDMLEQLRGELNTLDRLINQSLNNAQNTGDDVFTQLEAISGFTDDARNSSQQMLDHVSDFTDSNIDAVNILTADLIGTLDKIRPALDDLSDVGGRLERLAGQLGTAMGTLDGAVDLGDQAMSHLCTALDGLRRAGSDLSGASNDLQAALDQLMLHGSVNEQRAALERLRNSIAALRDAFTDISNSIDGLREVLKENTAPPDFNTDIDVDGILAALGNISAALADVFTTLVEVPKALEEIFSALDRLGEFLPTLEDIRNAHTDLRNALNALQNGGASLDAALDSIQTALDSYGPLSDQLSRALEQFQEVSDSAADIGTLLSQAFETVSGAVEGLTQNGPAEFTPLGEQFRQASDELYDALGGLSGQLERLNRTAETGSGALNADLRAINSQFQTVLNTMLDTADDLVNAPEESTVIQDTSDENIAATRDGKISDCRNIGEVEGDRNVGGVVGAMSIEFDLDPEDDATGALSFGATYETKAVLQNCVNYGSIIGKKDCVGGLTGRMSLGTVLDCQNYGSVTSTSGNYVGGIAGFADASIRSCWSKSILSGGNYIGGVAGWASSLRSCFAITTITQGTECLGAIAGGIETDGVLSGCGFVDTGMAGVDGVSYAGRAEPVPFDQLSQMDGIPQEFTTFTLTLLADGKVVTKIPFLYGEDLSCIELPPVPEREGCYGVWLEFDRSGKSSDITLEAVYAPWVTLVASAEQSGKLSLAFVEGQFTDQATLHVTNSAQTPPRANPEGTVTWNISLSGSELTGEDVVPLRLLSPSDGDADVWQYKNGQWVAVDAVRSGQYLLFTMEGTQGTFFIEPQGSDPWVIVLLVVAGAAILAMILLAVGKVRRKRNAIKPKMEQETIPKS